MKNQIIVAMDMEIPDGSKLISKIRRNEQVYGYKIGSLWVLNSGIDIIRSVTGMLREVNSDQKIILDMQKWGTDIPDIVTKQINYVAPLIDEAIVCPMGGGRQSLKAFADACRNNTIEPICVIQMTHPESDSYLDRGYVSSILYDALSFGIERFVIPATKEPNSYVKDILDANELDTTLYATGFKAQGGQTKPMVDFGVSKFIVGRAVYESGVPVATIGDIYREINEV